MNTFASFADPIGGWWAVFGLVAIGMLVHAGEPRVSTVSLLLVGLTVGALALTAPAGVVWAVGLMGAAFALDLRHPGRLLELAPILALSLAHGVGLAAAISQGATEVGTFLLGTAVLVGVGVFIETIRELSNLSIPDTRF